MLELALILAEVDPSYEDLALKFVQHFFWIAGAMDKVGQSDDEMWDDEDGFYLRRAPAARWLSHGACGSARWSG